MTDGQRTMEQDVDQDDSGAAADGDGDLLTLAGVAGRVGVTMETTEDPADPPDLNPHLVATDWVSADGGERMAWIGLRLAGGARAIYEYAGMDRYTALADTGRGRGAFVWSGLGDPFARGGWWDARVRALDAAAASRSRVGASVTGHQQGGQG